jgi:hypothetical protein
MATAGCPPRKTVQRCLEPRVHRCLFQTYKCQCLIANAEEEENIEQEHEEEAAADIDVMTASFPS